MPYVHLSAREWLESQRLQGCEFAPELLDLLDGQSLVESQVSALEEIEYVLNRRRCAEKPLFECDPVALEDAVSRSLDLLESLEEIISEFAEGFTCPNGTRPVDPDDLLRAMFESGRWLTYDL